MATNLQTQPLQAGEVTQEFKDDVTRETAWRAGYDDALEHSNTGWMHWVGTDFEGAYNHGYGYGLSDDREGNAVVHAYGGVVVVGQYVGQHRALDAVEPVRPSRARRLLSLVGAR